MIENFLTQEREPGKLEKEKVLEMLRANGFEHFETRNLVIEWTKQQEEVVAKENTAKARISFEIERADLYLAVGDEGGAIECLKDALYQSEQENERELCEIIREKMVSLKNSL